jgi:plastocyanin
MSRIVAMSLSFVLLLGLLLSLSPRVGESQEAVTLPAGVEVVASGLTNPRGFAWDADGELYLALAGTGGPDRIVREGTPRPFMIGRTSSIVRVNGGCTVPVAEDLPSRLWLTPGWIWGAMDVAILDGQLYALLGGGGPTNGQPDWPNGVYRVLADGSTELVANLSAWFQDNPTAVTAWEGPNPDGSLFALEAGSDRLWISEAVSGRLLTATTDGQIALVADLSKGHMVPTGIVLDDAGGAFVSHETVVPYPEGASKVIHVSPDGTVTDQWTGLTAGTGLAMGPDGVLYAAEMATNNTDEPPYLRPNSGRVVRQTGPDSLEPVVTEIPYPVHLDFGPDGALYLAYPAFGSDMGQEQGVLLRIDLSRELPISLAAVGALAPSCTGEAGAAQASGGTPAAASAAETSVRIADFAFMPKEVTVPAGTTVTWPNEDSTPHTVVANDDAFDSGRLDWGQQFQHVFMEPGAYAYHCSFHPGMMGMVVVT